MTSTAGAEPITAPGKSSTPHSGPTWHSPKEKSTLHACSPYLGGEKRVVGYYHGVKSASVDLVVGAEPGRQASRVRFNEVKAGKRAEVEFSVIDVDHGCVVAAGPDEVSEVPALVSVNAVGCLDPTWVFGSVAIPAPVYEARERHHRLAWTVPEGKNLCYRVLAATVDYRALMAWLQNGSGPSPRISMVYAYFRAS